MDLQFSLIAAFAFTCVLIELTPGPNMVYLAIISSQSGKKAGYFVTFGIAIGLLLIGVAASLGLTSIIHESPMIYQLLRWGGIVYLLWLAWDGWRDAETLEEHKIESSHFRYFNRGIITNLLNPKAGLFYIAMLPRFVSGDGFIITQMILLTVMHVMIATVIHFSIVTLASQASRFLHSTEHRRNFSRALAILLAIVAFWFAWTTRI